ncbi:hypothetical protein D9619_012437 [Psilocybe cf. subviscida]|uniref:Nephrocystin 3-like N-terminal domain-containing protein n=1 Tax=Psilocybe cf. subviscida TaxID=2480587 RepID=A0A8H5ASK1_9AGAR|nr:hypothetical protein D9619_012437 [Psilocybe cf. subviscida]
MVNDEPQAHGFNAVRARGQQAAQITSPILNVQVTKPPDGQQPATTASLTGHIARGTAHMFNNAQISNITGGDFRITNVNKVNALEVLHKRAAPNAILNAGGRADEVRCYPGTRKEVIGRIEKWRDTQDRRTPPIFWLSGPAGAGKTAIVQTIAERCNVQRIPQANFFFFRTDTSRNNLSPLVATLVHQLILVYPSLRDDVATVLSTNPLILDSVLEDQVWELIVRPLQAIQQSSPSHVPPLLMIDGLDECKDKRSQQQILHAFDKVLAGHPCPCRLLVASRDESQIQAGFNGISSPFLSLYLDDKYRPERDIRTFVNDKFKRVRRTHPLAYTLDPAWPSAEDVEDIVKKSSGQFIYAATVMRFIMDSSASPMLSLARVRGAAQTSVNLKSPFSHLDTIYTYILSQVDNQEVLKDILRAQLLILGHSEPSGSSVGVSYNQPMLADILQAYNPEYTKGIVQSCLADLTPIAQYTRHRKLLFHHASFPDYLRDKSRSRGYFVDIDLFNCKIQPELWKACRKLGRHTRSELGKFTLAGLYRLRQLPPDFLNTLTAQDLISVCKQPEAVGFSTPPSLFEHIHTLCACDDDVANYKEILCQWIYTRPQLDYNLAQHGGRLYNSHWPPCSDRYLAMTYIEDHVTTEPYGWIDIALRPETDLDAGKTASWLITVLRRIHKETYHGSVPEYRRLLRKWMTWATWNNVPLEGVDDLPKARWYLRRSRIKKWVANHLKLGSRPE